ncbi:TonB-dependent receptor domain-containing protein [Sphingomonas sp. MMS24-JH45]
MSDAAGVQTASLAIEARNPDQELRAGSPADRKPLLPTGRSAAITPTMRSIPTSWASRTRTPSSGVCGRFRRHCRRPTPPPSARSASATSATARTDTQVYAGFVNADYKLTRQADGRRSLHAGQDAILSGCTYDTNGGSLALINTVYRLFGVTAQINANECYTLTNAAVGSQTFLRTPMQQSIDQKNFAFRGVVDITPSDTTLVYASVSRGFKSGGFPVLAASKRGDLLIEQEQLTAYEVAMKLGLFDRSLQLNLAGFYYDYKNKQVYGRVADIIFTSLSRIRNIPKSREWGIEGDLTWRVTP